MAAHFSLEDLSGVPRWSPPNRGAGPRHVTVAVMNTVVGLVMIVWAHKERTSHWLGHGTPGSSFGGDSNPVARETGILYRIPVSLLKYLRNKVRIVAKTIEVINLAHMRTDPFDFNPILL